MDLKLGKSAYIKLKEGSKQTEITLDQVKNLLNMYIDRTSKTGDQVEWDYEDHAFPYTIEEKTEGSVKYLYLKAKQQLYNYLVIGVGTEEVDGKTQHYVQIVLPDDDYRALGDQAKGNEYAKYLAAYLQGELHMFNDRIIYYNTRK